MGAAGLTEIRRSRIGQTLGRSSVAVSERRRPGTRRERGIVGDAGRRIEAGWRAPEGTRPRTSDGTAAAAPSRTEGFERSGVVVSHSP